MYICTCNSLNDVSVVNFEQVKDGFTLFKGCLFCKKEYKRILCYKHNYTCTWNYHLQESSKGIEL